MLKRFLPGASKSVPPDEHSTEKAEFLNVPVQLLGGFLEDTRSSIRNIYYYSIYSRFIQLTKGNEKERYKWACEWLNFEEIDREENLYKGKILYDRYTKAPMTGIVRHMFSEFNQLEKTDFEKACFLAYHALKSIVGSKVFQKADNKLLWSRMDGKAKAVRDTSELSEKIRFFAQEYHTLKIKRELQENWGLVYYAQHTRGFYVSFKLDLKSLIKEALKRKKKIVHTLRMNHIRLLENQVETELSRISPKVNPFADSTTH